VDESNSSGKRAIKKEGWMTIGTWISRLRARIFGSKTYVGVDKYGNKYYEENKGGIQITYT
jgi:NADH:ubiquinone oxidoreductase subunit